MKVTFPKVLILDVWKGTSKRGNEYTVVEFLEQLTLDVYKVFCFGDSVAACDGLEKGVFVLLETELEPTNDGRGVQLRITSVGRTE